MDHKKNIFSMYRVLLLAVALPLVAVLLGVTTASTKATSKEVKSLTKNYMLSIVKQCGIENAADQKDEERHADHDHNRGQEHWRPRLCVRCVDWRGLRLGKRPDPDRY